MSYEQTLRDLAERLVTVERYGAIALPAAGVQLELEGLGE